MIIQVSLCSQRFKMLEESSGDEFFGGGFAVSTRQSHHRNGELFTMMARQILQSSQRMVNQQTFIVYFIGCIINNGISSAGLYCPSGKSIRIKLVAFQSKEQTARRYFAGIGTNYRMLQINLVKLLDSGHVLLLNAEPNLS